MTYSYDPVKIRARGKDQMRFELGDTAVDGGADTCVLADEEYDGILDGLGVGTRAWLFAKLYVLEAILFKLSYQVDTKIDSLQYGLGDRAERWQKLYEQTKAQIQARSGAPVMDSGTMEKSPYFHTDMSVNPRTGSYPHGEFPYRRVAE